MNYNKSLEMEKFKFWKQLNTMFYAQVYEVQLLDILTYSNCSFLLFYYLSIFSSSVLFKCYFMTH